MVAHAKAPITTFDTDWAKVRGWAQAQKIPTTAVNNVYQLDAARIQSGYDAMSDAERTRAVLAAAGMNAPTQLPTDSPSPTDVWGNTVRNVQSIATGLMPTRLVANIWDTLKTTVHDLEHPQGISPATWLTGTALSWIPGAYDIGTVLKAGSLGKGLDQLAEQPLTSIIDVMPYLKGLDLGAGAALRGAGVRTVATDAASAMVGKTLAERTGLAEAADMRLGAIRMAGRGIGNFSFGLKFDAEGNVTTDPAKTTFEKDENGNITIRAKTLAERYTDLATHSGMGRLLRGAAEALTDVTGDASTESKNLEGKLIELTTHFSPEQLETFNQILHSGRSAEDLVNDRKTPEELKPAIQAFGEWEQWHEKYMLDSGMAVRKRVPHENPDGTIGWSWQVYEKSSPALGAQRKAEDALNRATDRAKEVDGKLDEAEKADTYWGPKQARMGEIKDAIAGAATAGESTASKTYLNMFGRLVGKDGKLEQLLTAGQSKDWRTFKKVAGEAKKMLSNKGLQGWDQVPMLAELKSLINEADAYGKSRLKLEGEIERAWGGTSKSSKANSAQAMSAKAEQALKDYVKTVRENPPAAYRDVVAHTFVNNFLKSANAEARLDAAAAGLKGKGYNPEIVDRLRQDPKRLMQLVQALFDPTFRDPFLPDMISAGERQAMMNDALREAERMRARGETPMWVPTISAKEAVPYLRGTDVFINPTRFRPTVNSSFKKALDGTSTVYDVMLGVSKATKDLLGRDATVEFFTRAIAPMLKSGTDLRRAVSLAQFGKVETETSGGVGAVLEDQIVHEYGYAAMKGQFEIKQLIGLEPEELGLHPDETYYLPEDYLRQLDKIINKYQFPLAGTWDKATGVFKYSILGLSPRYTAHVAFGGGLMLALRSSPAALAYIPKALRLVRAYHKGADVSGEIPTEVFKGSAQLGSPDRAFHWMGGRSFGGLTIQEWLANHGINPKFAKGADVLRATADINFRFTRYISDMQRAIAYMDGSWQASRKKFIDPETGEKVNATPELMRWKGMQHAERVLGNLQSMTPLERAVARKIMPFYGWTKHVLKYVFTYPFDHPWRASFLVTLATQNTDNFSKGLDERMQLLFFLGSPDANGDVSAVDIRALDPFRDVANYATIGGWISALNPIITAPAAMIDPEIIFGNNVLHPQVTYSDLYGTTVAQPAGAGIMTALEAEVPELSAVDNAIGLTAQARAAKKAGGQAWQKTMFEALNVPFAQVQQLNLQQIAAKHELDRYGQARTDAENAWQTGDFSTLDKYPGTVPDPLQPDYDITPAELKRQYQAALKRNPKLPPSETTLPPPAPPV